MKEYTVKGWTYPCEERAVFMAKWSVLCSSVFSLHTKRRKHLSLCCPCGRGCKPVKFTLTERREEVE
jgi:hypothetical protein